MTEQCEAMTGPEGKRKQCTREATHTDAAHHWICIYHSAVPAIQFVDDVVPPAMPVNPTTTFKSEPPPVLQKPVPQKSKKVRKKTRQAISVKGLTYQRFKDYCDSQGVACSAFLEEIIAEDLDRKTLS